MRKSSVRTQNYLANTSKNEERLRRFHEQMADYARGEQLRQLRENQHESQERVAFELGVSPKSLRQWEHGGKIRWENAKRLGAFYGVDPEGLVSRETPEPGAEPALTQLDRIESKLDRVLDELAAAEIVRLAPPDVPPESRKRA